MHRLEGCFVFFILILMALILLLGVSIETGYFYPITPAEVYEQTRQIFHTDDVDLLHNTLFTWDVKAVMRVDDVTALVVCEKSFSFKRGTYVFCTAEYMLLRDALRVLD